ncbi:hypothetical protein GCM10022232_64920 [Streptomyces plumbiresistens]|uniref:Uncharacterized protein n=1 Tax=Streptomyces plumbiresistens TaxID=511811 RepID=A0ABP7SMM7_9ACTN
MDGAFETASQVVDRLLRRERHPVESAVIVIDRVNADRPLSPTDPCSERPVPRTPTERADATSLDRLPTEQETYAIA